MAATGDEVWWEPLPYKSREEGDRVEAEFSTIVCHRSPLHTTHLLALPIIRGAPHIVRSEPLIPPWVGVAHRWTQTRSMMVWITPVPCRVNPRRRRQRSCDEWDSASAGSGYTYFALGSRSRRGHNHVGSTSRFRGLLGLEVLELQLAQDHQCLVRLEPRACERIGVYLVLAFGGVESDLGGEQVGLGGGVGKVREVSGKWGACASPRRQSCHPRVSHGNTLPHAMLVRPSTSASSPTTRSTTTS